jgi:hypothetical protein
METIHSPETSTYTYIATYRKEKVKIGSQVGMSVLRCLILFSPRQISCLEEWMNYRSNLFLGTFEESQKWPLASLCPSLFQSIRTEQLAFRRTGFPKLLYLGFVKINREKLSFVKIGRKWNLVLFMATVFTIIFAYSAYKTHPIHCTICCRITTNQRSNFTDFLQV